jgi:hyperosmotically inducible protein
MKRLLALLVLLVIGGLAFYYWKNKPAVAERAAGSAAEEARHALGAVGERLHDTKVAGAVKAAFELNRELSPCPIDIDTRDGGVVTLKGRVPSEQVRAMAGKVAAAVPDVTAVVNQLAVDAALAQAPSATGRTVGESLDDKAMEAKVGLAFSLNRDLKGTDITVRSYQRHLTLGGQVDREAQRAVALEIARQAPSVLDVNDQITLRAGATPAASQASGERRRRVEEALAAQSSLAAYRIEVREEGGRILLRGSVKTAAEKDLAGLLARDVGGVEVDNGLRIGR